MPRIRRHRLTPILFLTPALLLVIVYFIVPLALTLWIGFTPLRNWKIDQLFEYAGLRNYEAILRLAKFDPDFKAVVKTTIVFVTATLTINVLGGLLLAIAAYIIDERVSLGFRLLWLLPRMTPVAIFGLLWYYFFYKYGTLNEVLLKLGLISDPVNWGTDPSYLPYSAWAIIVFVNGLVGVSYGMVIFYSAFKNIPREIITAAKVDGAKTRHIIMHILVPMVRWHIVFVTVWQLLSLLTSYAHLYVLTSWRVVDSVYGSTWALYVFNTAFSQTISNQGLAAAAASILVVIGVGLGLVTLRLLRFEEMMQIPRGEV